jgi:sortase A
MAIPCLGIVRPYPDPVRAVLRAVGELSITAGLILTMFCAYLLWGTSAYTQRRQLLLQREPAGHRPGAAPLDGIELGEAVALLGIPRLGRDYAYAVVEDAPEARYTYRVTSHDVVQPGDVDVAAPVPGKPDIRPIRAYITLSTCHPEYSAAQRLIVYGVLDKTEPRKE